MNASSSKTKALLHIGLSLSLCIFLAACSDKKDDKSTTQAGAKAQTQKIQTSVDRLVQWPEKDLRERARKAVIEQRWYKPTSDSALEYYLALKQKLNAPDESVDTALTDILPYAVIGMDQAIAKYDDREALRLEALIRMADPNAPALARVKGDLEKMKARQATAIEDAANAETLKAEADTKAKEEAAKAKDEAAKKAKDAATAEQTTVAPSVPLPPPVVQAPAAPVVQAPPPPQAAAPPPSVKAALVPLKTPQPEYPREALVAGTKGEVVAEITIGADGSVTNVRIISASPRNVFDKTVLSTVRRWKYQGNGETTTLRRTFVFN